jgi:predicted cupin superfamily sugar epimerase
VRAGEIVERLGLQPHPEGGWFAETFRDEDETGGRATSTAIYYLLAAGQHSHWHRVDAAEVWHFYAGDPLELKISEDGDGAKTLTLGADMAAGQQPQSVVAKGAWQSAQSLGAWTLVGCTVAPGFEFSGFEMAPPGWAPTAR